jgi:type IV secretory pathway VirB10-like protein
MRASKASPAATCTLGRPCLRGRGASCRHSCVGTRGGVNVPVPDAFVCFAGLPAALARPPSARTGHPRMQVESSQAQSRRLPWLSCVAVGSLRAAVRHSISFPCPPDGRRACERGCSIQSRLRRLEPLRSPRRAHRRNSDQEVPFSRPPDRETGARVMQEGVLKAAALSPSPPAPLPEGEGREKRPSQREMEEMRPFSRGRADRRADQARRARSRRKNAPTGSALT